MAFDSGLTAKDINDVFDTGISDTALGIWIDVAEEKVGDLPSHDDLTTARKKKITRFLTAALATAQDPRTSREEHETASVTYGDSNMGYMEVAQMLDPTNSLDSDPGAAPSIEVFEVKPYDDDRADTDRDHDGDID